MLRLQRQRSESAQIAPRRHGLLLTTQLPRQISVNHRPRDGTVIVMNGERKLVGLVRAGRWQRRSFDYRGPFSCKVNVQINEVGFLADQKAQVSFTALRDPDVP